MSTSKVAAKPRMQRLRASCDGCFLAKVKCSKARPICSRCLTCGTDCKYSPSSRAGKPKANKTTSNPNMSINIANPEIMANSALPSPFVFDSDTIIMASSGKNSSILTLEANWPVRCGPLDDRFPASSSSNMTPFTGSRAMMDTEIGLPFAAEGLFHPSFTWDQSGITGLDHSIDHIDASVMYQVPKLPTDAEVTQLGQFPSWPRDQKSIHYCSHQNNHSPCNTFNSSCSTPEFSSATEATASHCTCLKTCLQSLFALHEHTTPVTTRTEFEVVLNINSKAVEGCAKMLACGSCSSASQSSTNWMLLATIMEKILSFYQGAARTYLHDGPETHAQISIGAYNVTNEDGYWLKAKILWCELRKLHEVLRQFSSACAGSNGLGQDETGVHMSLVNHLSQNLNFTFEVMKLQQTGFGSLQ